MRVVITGGSGFLGSHLTDLFIGRGDEVVVVDSLVTGSLENLAHLEGHPALTVRIHDVAEPFDVGGQVDAVLHWASPASPKDFSRIPIGVMKANSYGTHNAIELARQKGATFFLASTSEVYGDPLVHPQPETYWGNVSPNGPRSVYDESKRYAESLTCAYRDHMGVDVRIVRFFNTYGPRMRLDDGRVVPNFVRQALTGEPLTVYGDGSQTRSFGYVADILGGVMRLFESGYKEPVNIGTQEERTVLEFAKLVIAATGSKSEIAFLPALGDDPKQRRPDLTRANTVLGWSPSTSLEEGLEKTVAYFKQKLGIAP